MTNYSITHTLPTDDIDVHTAYKFAVSVWNDESSGFDVSWVITRPNGAINTHSGISIEFVAKQVGDYTVLFTVSDDDDTNVYEETVTCA